MSERRTASALAYLHPDFCYIMDDDDMESAGIRAGDIVAFTACSHAEDGQIVAVQIDDTVLLRRLVCDGRMLSTCSTHFVDDVLKLDELPGAKIVGLAVEVRHIFEWSKEEAQEGQQ